MRVRSFGQAPIWMRLCAGLAGMKLTLLLRISATSGATNNRDLFLLGLHNGYIVHLCSALRWSILTNAFKLLCLRHSCVHEKNRLQP
jgi:hypothetical protein